MLVWGVAGACSGEGEGREAFLLRAGWGCAYVYG